MSLLAVGHPLFFSNFALQSPETFRENFASPMLDTIKLGIPLTANQYGKIKDLADKNDCWQWVLLNPGTGELLFRRTKGLAIADGQSFHRQLRWDIPHNYEKDSTLLIEFSIPKYWYGHNIRLLFDFIKALEHLKASLEQQFELKGKARLPNVVTWRVLRADVCYAWKFPSQRLAQNFLDSLKHLHYPRKKPIHYPTAILFAGQTYSVKFYLKLPEFKSHDRKELLKQNAALEWINYCEEIADGVLRFEATLRQKYLKRQNIKTVKDLIRPMEVIEWVEGTSPKDQTVKALAVFKITGEHLAKQFPPEPTDLIEFLMSQLSNPESMTLSLKDGENISFDAFTLNSPSHVSHIVETLPVELQTTKIEAGVIGYRRWDRLTTIAQSLLVKFIGENAGMQRVDEIKAKLLDVYKPVKAARLVSFWLYVQRFGSAEAKEVFGRDSYYYSVREIKKAGISMIEPPSGKNITVLDRDFMQQFRMEIPSQFAVNKVDDFRDSGNILNFVPKMSGLDELA